MRALMMWKSCAVEMRNAILGNHLKYLLKKISSSNTNRRKPVLNFVWNTWKYWWSKNVCERLEIIFVHNNLKLLEILSDPVLICLAETLIIQNCFRNKIHMYWYCLFLAIQQSACIRISNTYANSLEQKCLHKERVELPQDWFGTPTWPPLHCFGTPMWLLWRHVHTLHCGEKELYLFLDRCLNKRYCYIVRLSRDKMSSVIGWFMVTCPRSNSNVSRPGYNCAVVARTAHCLFVFAIWLFKGKSWYITKHLIYGPSGN